MEKPAIIFRQGPKVTLRPVLEEDVPFFQAWMNDRDVSQFLRTFGPVSLEDEMEWFRRVSKQRDESYTLALVDSETGELIGCMGMHDIVHRSGIATTGSVIGNKNYWGRGYGTEAKMLLLEFAFHELNLRKVYSDVIAFNERSIAYAKKCGYVEEARLPKHYYRKGKYWDKVMLAVYRKPWEKLWKEFQKNSKI